MSDREQLFAQWLSGELNTEQQREAEALFSQDPIWQERMNSARQVAFLASTNDTVQVPKWDRAKTFISDKEPWWRWQGLPAMSMAFSCFALVLVIFKVDVVVNDSGLLVSFGSQAQQEQQQVVKLVDDKLAQFAQQQALLLADFSLEQSNMQQKGNLQLASYILETSRQERKEDISDFISYISQQRKDDQVEHRIRYRQLENAINYQSTVLNNPEMSLQPASWVVEE